MQDEGRTTREWAHEEFGHTEPGDARRTARLVRMAAALAERPGGKVLTVFRSNAEQQGAYDLLGNEHVRSDAMLSAVEAATVARCDGQAWVHVVVDGTSLRLSDVNRTKDFGGVGSTANGARGLKVRGEEQVLWWQIDFWGPRAAKLAPYVTKGRHLLVHGEMRVREHQGRTFHDLRALEVEFLGSREGAGEGTPSPNDRAGADGAQAPNEAEVRAPEGTTTPGRLSPTT